ncbi:MAG: hypothetical protein AB8B56_11275 [Crocinitomicaceae bacterium]
MKLISVLVLVLLCNCVLFGQQNVKKQVVPTYDPKPILAGGNVLFIPVNFNESQLKDKIPSELKSLTIERIDLVYTTFKESPTFNQEKLNNQRMERLKSAWPETKNELIHWNFIGQKNASNRIAARSLFHGFAIYYREKPTSESIDQELDLIDAYLQDGVFPAEKKMPPLPGVTAPDRVRPRKKARPESEGEAHIGKIVLTESVEEALFSHSVAPRSVDMKEVRELKSKKVPAPDNEHPRVSSLRDDSYQNECYTSKGGIFVGNSAKFKAFDDSMMSLGNNTHGSNSFNGFGAGDATKYYYLYYYIKKECDTEDGVGFGNPYVWDSEEFNAVQATFKRHPNWQNTLVIMDVTGSMSPYIAKTMAWVEATQDSSQVKAFTFFNDGDATPDQNKRTGNVGGVYGVENEAFDPVLKKMKYTMRKGGGGDCPENNVEATIKGMKLFSDCDEIIMVADNWATPRDLSLLDKVSVPIHIILCGAQPGIGINVDYIQAAYDTGGSVHTIEDDLDMRSIESGKQFRIGRSYFTIAAGRIVKAKHK